MKKFLALILALVMTLALCACGETKTDTPAPTEAAAAENTAAAGENTEVVYDEVTLRLSHPNSIDQPIGKAFDNFAALVNERSGGKVTVDVYPSSSLYSNEDAQAAIQLGNLDMCLIDTSTLSNDLPLFSIYSLPFLYDSYETLDKVVNGDIGAANDKIAEDQLGIVPLGWGWNGVRNMCTNDPLTSLADCKNYKLRSPGADIYINTFKLLGMSPTIIPWGDCYTAMQSGVVDGVETTTEAIYTQGFAALGGNVCLSRHMFSIVGLAINKDKFDSLNEATQQLLRECWTECRDELNKTVEGEEDGYIQKIKDDGCNVTEFSDRDDIVAVFTPYWQEMAEKGGYTEQLNEILALIGG